jgi:hypothetical protein
LTRSGLKLGLLKHALASKEKQVTESVIPVIEGKIINARCVAGGIPFKNLDHLTDGTPVPGNPINIMVYVLDSLIARYESSLMVISCLQLKRTFQFALIFFLAAKGPDGSLAVAGRQACYDGTLGARGIHSLQNYGKDEPLYNNNAGTIIPIYHGGQLKMFTTHLGRPAKSGDRSEYYMTQINTWGMTGNVETFRQGAVCYRNKIMVETGLKSKGTKQSEKPLNK